MTTFQVIVLAICVYSAGIASGIAICELLARRENKSYRWR